MHANAPGADQTWDVVVVGSGAAGMAAAVTAAVQGCSVALLEKDNVLGGITAWSGAWLWVPGNRFGAQAGVADSAAAARTYLENELGERFDAQRVDAFLAAGPAALDYFERHSALRFELGALFPDYHPATLGAARAGRSFRVLEYDGAALGPHLQLLRPLMPELTFLGMGVASGGDMKHFARAMRSPASAWYVARRLGAYALDRLRHGRSMRLVNGNALIGRLLRTAIDRGVAIHTQTPATTLITTDGRVTGVLAGVGANARRFDARRGVILACGGFGHDAARQRAQYAHVARGAVHLPVAPAAVAGDGLRLGEQAGGQVVQGLATPAILCPVSRVPRGDGSHGMYPHFVDRGKPGVIAIDPSGRRFVNESNSYHDVVTGMLATCAGVDGVHAWLVCDARALRRYGLGYAKPFPVPVGRLVRAGYLKRAATLRELAAQIGVDAATLEETVATFNRHAQAGEDPVFGRGGNVYNHFQGDPDHRPNPCLAPLDRAPYYAVEIFPGDLGTAAGLVTDGAARVLDAAGDPIAGLYAAGNDMATLMAGNAPAGGVTVAPALVFGHLAALHASGGELPAC